MQRATDAGRRQSGSRLTSRNRWIPYERYARVDGTELVATRVAAGAGNPGALSTAATAEELATCEGCFLGAEEGDVDRLRVTTETADASEIVLEDVRLVAKGKSARRVRWDVLRLR